MLPFDEDELPLALTFELDDDIPLFGTDGLLYVGADAADVFLPEDGFETVPAAERVPVAFVLLIEEAPVTFVAELLAVTVLPADMPLLFALRLVVVLEMLLALRPVVLLMPVPPRSDELPAKTLSEPVWYL